VFLALLAGSVFAIAVILDPYRDGRVWMEETHRQLGLPPCTLRSLTSLPCASCGMSTSFALAVRGDFYHSVQANFAGTLLALFGMAFIPWSLASALKGRLLGIRSLERAVIWTTLGFMAIIFGRWGILLLLMWLQK